MQKFITILFLSFLVQSCLYNYPTTTSTTEVEKADPEYEVQKAILKHLENIYKDNLKPYTFGTLYTLKPKEFIELDQLIEVRNQLPSMKDHYGDQLPQKIAETDTLIEQKKREIKSKKIYPMYQMDHVYVTNNDSKSEYTATEANFTLNPDYTINDVQISMNAKLTPSENELFYKFMMRVPMFTNDTDPNWAQKQDENAYNTFINTIEEAQTPVKKNEILVNVLYISELIRKTNKFDEESVCKLLSTRWIYNNESDIKNRPEKYSKLKEIYTQVNDTTKNIAGYNMNVMFTTETKEGEKTTKVYQFIFDLNFLIAEVRNLHEPFEEHFTEIKN